jgi:hypothetical protein
MPFAVIAAGAPAPAAPLPPRRRARGPWAPSAAGPYKLPREAADRLTAALAGFRNREAAFALAVFLGRFWSAPARLMLGFPIDRRALADHPLLGLSEHQVRAARETLEAIGFITRQDPEDGRHFQRTADGPHRRPTIFRFGADYLPAFATANRRTQTARRPIAPIRPSPTLTKSSRAVASHKQSSGGAVLLMGDQRPPQAEEPESPLEAALARWRKAIEG